MARQISNLKTGVSPRCAPPPPPFATRTRVSGIRRHRRVFVRQRAARRLLFRTSPRSRTSSRASKSRWARRRANRVALPAGAAALTPASYGGSTIAASATAVRRQDGSVPVGLAMPPYATPASWASPGARSPLLLGLFICAAPRVCRESCPQAVTRARSFPIPGHLARVHIVQRAARSSVKARSMSTCSCRRRTTARAVDDGAGAASDQSIPAATPPARLRVRRRPRLPRGLRLARPSSSLVVKHDRPSWRRRSTDESPPRATCRCAWQEEVSPRRELTAVREALCRRRSASSPHERQSSSHRRQARSRAGAEGAPATHQRHHPRWSACARSTCHPQRLN